MGQGRSVSQVMETTNILRGCGTAVQFVETTNILRGHGIFGGFYRAKRSMSIGDMVRCGAIKANYRIRKYVPVTVQSILQCDQAECLRLGPAALLVVRTIEYLDHYFWAYIQYARSSFGVIGFFFQ